MYPEDKNILSHRKLCNHSLPPIPSLFAFQALHINLNCRLTQIKGEIYIKFLKTLNKQVLLKKQGT